MGIFLRKKEKNSHRNMMNIIKSYSNRKKSKYYMSAWVFKPSCSHGFSHLSSAEFSVVAANHTHDSENKLLDCDEGRWPHLPGSPHLFDKSLFQQFAPLHPII